MKHLALALFFASFCSLLHAQINWQSTNGPEGGSFSGLCFDPQYAFTGDEYHLYRTADGSNWEQLSEGNLWPIATSPSKLAAGQGYGYSYSSTTNRFKVSYNHGSTWIEGTMPPTKYGTFTNLAVCSHGIYVPDGGTGRMYRTQDDGLTWDTIAAPGLSTYDLWAFDDRLYAGGTSKFWRLATNGTDWELISPNFGASEYATSMYASGSLLLFATEHNLWASGNGGISWKQTATPFHNSKDNFVRIADRIYKSGGGTGILYTDDFGFTWPELPIPKTSVPTISPLQAANYFVAPIIKEPFDWKRPAINCCRRIPDCIPLLFIIWMVGGTNFGRLAETVYLPII